MLITPAYAQAASASPAGGGFGSLDSLIPLLPFAAIYSIFYLLLIRPEKQKVSRFRSGLQKGDEVVTAAGIIGTVYKVVDANEIIVEIAPETRVRVVRSTVGSAYVKSDEGTAPKIKAKGT